MTKPSTRKAVKRRPNQTEAKAAALESQALLKQAWPGTEHGPDRILEYSECAYRYNASLRTWMRVMAGDDRPPYIEISPRRRGVLESDFYAWLTSRRRPAPGSLEQRDADALIKRPRGRPRKQSGLTSMQRSEP
jgi:hypothetical protein